MLQPTILIVSGTPPPYSGPEVMTAHLLNSSLKDYYRLLHFNISKGRDVETKARFDWLNVGYGLLQPFQLLWLMLRHQPDLVYTNMAQNLGGFLRYASFILVVAFFHTPVVVRVMGDGFDHFYRRANTPLRWLIRLVMGQIDGFIVRADTLKHQFQGIVPLEKLWIVHSGINVTEFDRPRTRHNDTLRVLFVGYLTKAKGAHDLLRAIPLVHACYPQVTFQLMGARVNIERNITYVDNPISNDDVLDDLLANPEIGSHAELLGVLAGDAKATAFVNADIFILPSFSEAFPTVVLEAMAAGLPVVATPVGVLPEIFDEQHILFVEPGNVEQIAAAIGRLAADPALRQTMGVANRRVAHQQFDLSSHGEQMARLFDRYLSNSTTLRPSSAP
ncbi:MAG: glycosyltransferase family 4 protein [Caldilineaceae bacterium]|nr:glycosyltransferase family 4 protein [Caldilineaceae bacterium]